MASIPSDLAVLSHPVVEVNTEDTPFTEFAEVHLRGSAKDVLPGLIDLLTSHTVRAQQERGG